MYMPADLYTKNGWDDGEKVKCRVPKVENAKWGRGTRVHVEEIKGKCEKRE